MKKSKQWGVVFLWIVGFGATSLSVLTIAFTAVWVLHGVPPGNLPDIIKLWGNLSLIIAFTPSGMVLLGVADDRLLKRIAEMGLWMVLYGNPVGLVYSFWCRVLIPWATLFSIARSNLHLGDDASD